MDGHPRQNPAYRPATRRAPATGLFLCHHVCVASREWARRIARAISQPCRKVALASLARIVYPPPRSMMTHIEDTRFLLAPAAHATVAMPCSLEQAGDGNARRSGNALAERRMR